MIKFDENTIKKGYFIHNGIFAFRKGVLSQWYGGFVAQDSSFFYESMVYKHCEQWMMAHKAILFNDKESFSKIMDTRQPKVCQYLGGMVKNFEQERWDNTKEHLVFMGNLLKFSQNPSLGAFLLSTGDNIIAEASPTDKIWGIGCNLTDENAYDKDKWRGQNLLGESLMKVRECLRHAQVKTKEETK
jgi:ribA/ribD-fused uncharacterized protein